MDIYSLPLPPPNLCCVSHREAISPERLAETNSPSQGVPGGWVSVQSGGPPPQLSHYCGTLCPP